MRKARKQNGSLYLDVNGSKTPVWKFSWWHILPNGKHVRRKRQVGTLDQYKTEAAAERAVRSWRLAINSNQVHAFSGIRVSDVIEHFRLKELVDKGENGRAWSTRDRYGSYLDRWIGPRWGKEELTGIKAPVVEEWLEDLMFDTNWRRKKAVRHARQKPGMQPLAPASKSRIRGLMSVLFNHAIRWGFTDRNPISGPNKGAGVRQSSKRQRIPDILEVEEIQRMLERLQLRERVLVFLAMATGLRQGELAGLQWRDIDFEKLLIDVNKSVVYQVVGRCKTEASKKPVPLDTYTAEDLLTWYRHTPYRSPEDWVFASDSSRAGKKRGKQPLWLQTVMRYHIQPVVKALGINKRVSWHTFRRTYSTLLKANGEDVKVVQELLRHASARITMDVYAQAMTPAKRAAQQKVVEMVRPEKPPLEAKKMA
ncbi:MAG: tyrosine-type recombinase/integrase [Acidobacteriaceae bacterium]